MTGRIWPVPPFHSRSRKPSFEVDWVSGLSDGYGRCQAEKARRLTVFELEYNGDSASVRPLMFALLSSQTGTSAPSRRQSVRLFCPIRTPHRRQLSDFRGSTLGFDLTIRQFG